MSRSISARIFSGFLLVTIALSAVMGYTLFRMRNVQHQFEMINSTYLRLTLSMDRLYLAQEKLTEDPRPAGYGPTTPTAGAQTSAIGTSVPSAANSRGC